jgi:hypothetical protein
MKNDFVVGKDNSLNNRMLFRSLHGIHAENICLLNNIISGINNGSTLFK